MVAHVRGGHRFHADDFWFWGGCGGGGGGGGILGRLFGLLVGAHSHVC